MRPNRIRRRSSNQPIFVTVASAVVRRNVRRGGNNESEALDHPGVNERSRVSDLTTLSKLLKLNFIPKYLDLMFYVGASIYSHAAANHSRVVKSLNKTAFVLLSFCAFLDGLLMAKYFGLEYSDTNKLDHYVSVLQFMMLAYSRIYLMLTMINEEEISQVYRAISSLKDNLNPAQSVNVDQLITRVVVGSTLTATLGRALFSNLSFSHITFHNVLSFYAFFNVHSMTVWSTENYRNRTNALVETYWPDYETVEYSPMKVVHGLIGMWFKFCSALQDSMLEDILLLTAITNYTLMLCFRRRLPNLAMGNPSMSEFEGIWNLFIQFRDISVTIESCFGRLLNLSHFNNLLSFARVLIKFHGRSYDNLDVIWLLLKVLKASCAYYMSSKASSKNKDIERWIFDWQLKNPSFDSATISRIQMAMLDLIRDPVGVGRDQFYVDGGFIGKFIGLIASFFLFRVQEKEKDGPSQ